MPEESLNQPADDTRTRLIHAGLRQFGKQGFAAASTRALAAEAGANLASIAYHFGSKAGLYEACTDQVVAMVEGTVGAPADHAGLRPDQAAARLDGMVRAMVDFLVTAPMAEAMVGFVLRELTEQGAALAAIYDRLFEAKHRELCALWGAATGQPAESEGVRLAVFAMIGQVIYFRIARPVVLRRMDWPSIGPAEAGRIADVLSANLRAALERSAP